MSVAKDLEAWQTQNFEEIEVPPSDLYSEEPPLESYLHLKQILLLLSGLEWFWRDRDDFFAAGNLTIYYSPRQIKTQDFRGPDFFVVLGTERKPRKSWVVWDEEGKYPNIIIELLSDSTAKTDRGEKKLIYQNTFRTPDYFWFDPHTLEFRGFHLVDGEYQELQPNEKGLLWSQQLQLCLGVYQEQLRFFTPEGELILTPEETAKSNQEQLEVEREQLEMERQKNEKLAAKLRELNIDPESL
ncbi:restriction endonuclease family protein [Lyngbya aestuarii BL J]|uniref:Restriction endonuclease family protein n=1 Tax=Lyngbya aestuarii BL J TaxID=1348334 RepID=U7QIK2_9CYAN|nr:Uma2 family endonuclease [Lyngbya aestuarii]ERT07723.1 restriction endonuclease family protein [Lyngbya aestuarii BL J]